jgi:8-oxo-dGTP pyrophosphatase MutT (NUDIX family)
MSGLPDRPAARLLVIDAQDRILLFRFTPGDRPPFWGTPGGQLDEGESFEDAARRELLEETGIAADPGPSIAFKTSVFTTFEGVKVRAVEHYFVVRVDAPEIVTDGHTEMERDFMQEHRWWSAEELARCPDPYYPPDLPALIEELTENVR